VPENGSTKLLQWTPSPRLVRRNGSEGFVTLLKIERGFFGLHGYNHAAATTSRQVCMAEALKARCVLAEMRWRWT
jgi:hypothetical protein